MSVISVEVLVTSPVTAAVTPGVTVSSARHFVVLKGHVSSVIIGCYS